jgi:hypothetical protein
MGYKEDIRISPHLPKLGLCHMSGEAIHGISVPQKDVCARLLRTHLGFLLARALFKHDDVLARDRPGSCRARPEKTAYSQHRQGEEANPKVLAAAGGLHDYVLGLTRVVGLVEPITTCTCPCS